MSVFIPDCSSPDGKSGRPIKKSRRKYLTKYNAKYQVEYPWALPSSKGDLHSYCDLCEVHICIKSVGAKGLRDHEATCRHSQKAHQLGLKPAIGTVIIPMMTLPPTASNGHHQRFVTNQSFIQPDANALMTNSMVAANGQRSNGGMVIQQNNEIVFSSNELTSFPQQQFNGHVVMTAPRNHQMQNSNNVVINPPPMIASTMYATTMPMDSIEVDGARLGLCKSSSMVNNNSNVMTNSFHDHNPIPNSKMGVGFVQESQQKTQTIQINPLNSNNAYQIECQSNYQQKKIVEYQQAQCAPTFNKFESPATTLQSHKPIKRKCSSEKLAQLRSMGCVKSLPATDQKDEFVCSDERLEDLVEPLITEKQKEGCKENPPSLEDLTCNICEQIFLDWKDLKKHLLNHIKNAQKIQSTSKGLTSKNKEKHKGKKNDNLALVLKEKRKRGRPVKNSETTDATGTSNPFCDSPDLLSSSSKLNRKRGRPPKACKNEISKNGGILESDTFSVAEEEYWVETFELENPQEEPTESVNDTPTALIVPEATIAPSRRAGQLQCRVCKGMFYHRDDLQNHYKTEHNNGKPYECDICNKFFTTKNHLEVHQKHKHNPGPDPCQCTECGKIMSSRTNLRIHMKIHKGEKPFVCPVCTKSFSRKANMEMHKVYHTGERKFTCEICGQSFFAINALRRHKKLHTGERDYACDVCGATYVTGTDLRRHKLKHDDVKPFPCTICEKQFTRAHDLKVHMRYHNKELRFRCETCGKMFVESGNFKRHMRRHTGERPYTCKVCQQTFTQVHHYKIHIQNNHLNSDNSVGDQNTSRTSEEHGAKETFNPLKNKLRNNKMYQSNVVGTDLNSGLNVIPSNTLNSNMIATPSSHAIHSNPGINTSTAHGSNIVGGVPMMTTHPAQGNPPGGFLQYNSYIYSNTGVIQQYPNLFDMCPPPQQPQPGGSH